jgi:hypothetical protein
MRIDLLERVHRLPMGSAERQQVMDLFGCFSLATVVLRMQKMTGEARSELEHQIEAILECGQSILDAPAALREDARLPGDLRRWLWQGRGDSAPASLPSFFATLLEDDSLRGRPPEFKNLRPAAPR